MLQERITQFVGELRNIYILGKESAIGIWKGGKRGIEILASLVGRGIENLEELYQSHSHIFRLIMSQEIMEHISFAEDSCILSIEAKYQPHAKNVQVTQ